jgi:hypothetical protein
VSRAERGLVPGARLIEVAELLSVVGLDLSCRAYPAGQPIRDAGHVALLAAFRSRLHRSLRWATEVPLPLPGDQRAWDAMVTGPDWRYGVEAETRPTDAQALERRLALKQRDGDVSGVLLVLPQTRAAADFVRAAATGLVDAFPVPSKRALELLGAGIDPSGNAIVVVPVSRPERGA